MSLAAIGLGANLPSHAGPPAATLLAAVDRLAGYGEVVARSSLYRTAPVGIRDQPEFLNAAVLLQTDLPPGELMRALLEVERCFGRNRSQSAPKGPRPLDLDLLAMDDLVLDVPGLKLPHPAMHERGFVLEPLREIAPRWWHPILHRTNAELLAGLPRDAGAAVTRIDDPEWDEHRG